MTTQSNRALKLFKQLHRTVGKVFQGDAETIKGAKLKINEQFRFNLHETDPEKLNELLKTAEDADYILRTMVVQMEYEPEKNVFKMSFRDEVLQNTDKQVDPKKSPT